MVVEEILQSTQLVGVSNITRHKNPKLRYICIFVIIASLIFCGCHVGNRIAQFCKRDTSLTSVSKLNDSINFPALELRWSARGQLNENHSLYTMEVANCTFAGEQCTVQENFTKFSLQFKERHGHVYIFNSAMGAELPSYAVVPATRARFDVHLKLRRSNDSGACINELVANDAMTFNVAVEPPAQYLYGADSSEETKWIPLHHNWYTQVRLHVTHIKRLGEPFNNCQREYSDEAKAIMHPQISSAMYSLQYCKKVCEHTGEWARCGCVEDNRLIDIEMFNQSLPRCNGSCPAYSEADRRECRNKCLPPCEQLAYETFYSWTNVFFKENCDFIMYHLEISYPSTGLYTIIEEEEIYPLEEFLAEASGLLNFYLGFSLAVVAEVGILIAGYCCKKNCGDVEETPKTSTAGSVEGNLRKNIYGSQQNVVPPRGYLMTPVINAFGRYKAKRRVWPSSTRSQSKCEIVNSNQQTGNATRIDVEHD